MLIDIRKIGKNLRFLNLHNQAQYQGCATAELRFKLPSSIPCTLEGVNFNGVNLDPATDISGWDISRFTGMPYMFENMVVPTGVDTWDFSKVQNMEGTFQGADISNVDITQLDVSSAGNMMYLLEGSNFNGDISTWTINAHNVYGMLRRTPYTHDLSSMVLPNVYFLDAMDRGQPLVDVFWSDENGNPLPAAKRPKTAIEAGVGIAPIELIAGIYSEIRNQSTTNHYIQVFDDDNLVESVQDMAPHPSNYSGADPSETVKVYGARISKMTFVNFNTVISWGGHTAASNVRFVEDYTLVVPATAPGWSDWAGLFAGCQDLSVEAESWDTSHVTNMNYLLPQDYSGSLDLSGWSVPLIASKPIGWPLPPERSPVWGQ